MAFRMRKGTLQFDENHQLLTKEEDLFPPRESRPPLPMPPPRPVLREPSHRAPMAEGEYRIEGSPGGCLIRSWDGRLYREDSRLEAQQRVADLKAEDAGEVPAGGPVAVLDCHTLFRLEFGGAPHRADWQDPHDSDFSCRCVRPNPREAIREHGSLTYSSRADEWGPCLCPARWTTRSGIEIHLCCRCNERLDSDQFYQAIRALQEQLGNPIAGIEGARTPQSPELLLEGLTLAAAPSPASLPALSTEGPPVALALEGERREGPGGPERSDGNRCNMPAAERDAVAGKPQRRLAATPHQRR